MNRSATDFRIVTLGAVTWDFPLVGRSRMLTEAWHTLDQPTTFVQVPSLRTGVEKIRATLRLRPRPAHVVRPWPNLPPRFWSSSAPSRPERWLTPAARELYRQLDRRLDWSRAVAVVISPVWAPWLAHLPFAQVIYDCIDELAVHLPRADLLPLFERWENMLLERADAVAVSAVTLGDAINQRFPDKPTRLIQNGVDVDRFQHRAAQHGRPVDLPDTTRPIVGFVGALYEWIDWVLIDQVTAAVTDADFVFVGPWQANAPVDKLRARPHVTFLGPRPYETVPSYMAAFDVCWVPFDRSRISAAANPVKIYEYLALGKPVVTTPVADTDRFDGLLYVGDSIDQIATHLRSALQNPAAQQEQRIAFARKNDWRARAQRYIDFVDDLRRSNS
jgi:hypothetical protein